jgi:hypothetical protein
VSATFIEEVAGADRKVVGPEELRGRVRDAVLRFSLICAGAR